jgi:CRP-like cAMP-binding protein
LVSGRLKLLRDTYQGTPLLVHTAYAGESFAEASLFSDKYHCYCVAQSAVEVVFFPKQMVLDFLHTHPKIMINFVQILTNQVRYLRQINEIKSIRSAQERTLIYLNYIANQGEVVLLIPLKDMAQKIGLTHESFYRALSALEATGRIQKTKSSIQILCMI